jgi:hypothetical protein
VAAGHQVTIVSAIYDKSDLEPTGFVTRRTHRRRTDHRHESAALEQARHGASHLDLSPLFAC